MNKATVGTKVRLTGAFLQSTGQYAGGEGQSTWTVVACPCKACQRGDLVAVNEPHYCQTDPRGYEDVPVEQRPKFRHINPKNLEKAPY